MEDRHWSEDSRTDGDDDAPDTETTSTAVALSSHEVTRRKFMLFLGAGAGALMLSPFVPLRAVRAHDGGIDFTPIRVPSPLPVHTERESFLPTGIGTGDIVGPTVNGSDLTDYTVIDDVVVPPEYDRYVIIRWGDRPFRDRKQYVGNNHDYTGFVPLGGGDDDDDDGGRTREGLLWINHEYNSFPFSDLAPGVPTFPGADLRGFAESFPAAVGFSLPNSTDSVDGTQTGLVNDDRLLLLGEMLYNVGGSILLIRKDRRGRWNVVDRSRRNRRIHGLSGLAINAGRADGYETVTSWGSIDSHQEGNNDYLIGTGPAATDVFEGVNSDGLGNRIIGTGFNCSGATTPWGTVLSAEENFQGSSLFYVGVQEFVKPDGSQVGYAPGTSGELFGLVGEKYGYMVEIDLKNKRRRARKHTYLGRFRHENVALRVQRNKRLVCYQGDDRRGGHTWKYVSDGRVRNPKSKSNSRLLEKGTLYVARFYPNGTGEWLPLELSTPTNPHLPSDLASQLPPAVAPDDDANTFLPQRSGLGGAVDDGGEFEVTVTNEAAVVGDYQGKTLADFYPTTGAMLCDAFLAANLIGGTPGGRPEDIEVHPYTKDVYVAYTDNVPGSDGFPDSRIFQVAKTTTDVDGQQPSGAIYRIIENSSDGTGTTFRWERFVEGGEAGAVNGAGFAQADNMLFDKRANLWVVTDMSTSRHNGFRTGANAALRTIDHTETGADDGSNVDTLPGVFGNNWLFVTPTKGPDAGKIVPFAYGPTRCEMTGPTIVDDTLLLAVQHPGEDVPIGDGGTTLLNRDIEMLDLDGNLFTQNRTVTLGSNFPSSIEGDPTGVPRSCVVGIYRVKERGDDDDDDDGRRRRGDDDDDD